MITTVKKYSGERISIILFLVFAFFSDSVNNLILKTQTQRYILWGITLLIALFVFVNKQNMKMNKKRMLIFCLIAILAVFQNKASARGDYSPTIRWGYFLLFGLLFAYNDEVYEKSVRYTSTIGLVHVFATYLFFFMPALYRGMVNVWGYWPTGTSGGKNGYRAALTNHYSLNGIVLAVTYLALAALFFGTKKDDPQKTRKRKLYFVLLVLTVFAVVLTTKRAHLVFGLIAIIIIYYFCNPEQTKNHSFKLFVASAVTSFGIIIASNFVPAIQAMLARFDTTEEDTTMESRYVLWDLAIRMFKRSPIFGNGMWSYRYQFRSDLYDTSVRAARYELMNCHNVYLQLLAENGIIGLGVFAIITITLLRMTFICINNEKKKTESNMLIPLLYSAYFQIFFLLYCFTGNCLYDITFAFYVHAIGIALGCYGKEKIIKEEKNGKINSTVFL